MEVGLANLAINNRKAEFINAAIGGICSDGITIKRGSDGEIVSVPCHNMESLLGLIGNRTIEMLHMDVQGAELSFIKSINKQNDKKIPVRFIVVSTHGESISGSRTNHMDCIRELARLGANILVEHSIDESYSGDGLIVASFFKEDEKLLLPEISRNTYCC
jgi:hypothetical protein